MNDAITECEREVLGYAEKVQEVRNKTAADPRFAQYLQPCSAHLESALLRLRDADGSSKERRVLDAVSGPRAVERVHHQ